ncbi:MAG: tetratricopeptide repeat protein [Archangium sp.]
MKRVALACAVFFAACPKPGDDVDPKVKADGHYLVGQSAYLKGDFATAHKEFAEVKALNPNDPRLPAAEGEVYLAEVKIVEAIESFEAAVKLDPKRGTNWSRLGYLYGLKGEKAKSKEALEKALGFNPRDFNALDSMADLQLGEGKVDEAVKSLVTASEAAPDGVDYAMRAADILKRTKRDDEALALLEGAVKKGIKGAPIFAELGDRYVRGGKLELALASYTEAAKADPKDPAFWELVGEVQLKLGKPVEAEAAFQNSLKVQDRGVVHVALARMCQTKKDDACVKAELDKALEKATGEDMRETLELGDLLSSLGRKKDALELFRQLSEESEQKLNIELHLKTARLAHELKDEVQEKAACTRALSNGQAGIKCP